MLFFNLRVFAISPKAFLEEKALSLRKPFFTSEIIKRVPSINCSANNLVVVWRIHEAVQISKGDISATRTSLGEWNLACLQQSIELVF